MMLGGGLPSGYQAIEYIVGKPGEARFTTPIYGDTQGLAIRGRVMYASESGVITNYTPFFNNYVDEATNVTRLIRGTDKNTIIANLNNRASISTTISHSSIKPNTPIDFTMDSNGITVVAGQTTLTGTWNITFAGAYNHTLIAVNSSSSTSTTTYIGLNGFYFLDFYSTGVPLAKYRPCIQKSTNYVGMYDLVTKTFYKSEGDGEFYSSLA